MRAELSKRAEQFKRATAAHGKTTHWRSALEFPTPFVARECRAADLVIIGRNDAPHDAYRCIDAGDLLLRAGRPILVVPPGINELKAKRILIAWKDTREARRAVRDALPLLQNAQNVTVAEVAEFAKSEEFPEMQASLRDVGTYLDRHGIVAETVRIRPMEGTSGETLFRCVEDQSFDLIVAGGYGHSRLGEWLFGGVTHDLLNSSPVCCLLSH
jgi:nucleotide-binding universal stress UspA family protein